MGFDFDDNVNHHHFNHDNFNNHFDLDSHSPNRPKSIWHPSLRAAVIMWAFLLGISILNSFTLGISFFLCYPVQLVLYLINGYLAGHFALNEGYRKSELPRVGALAGLLAWILPTLYYFIFSVVLGLVTVGIGFFGMAAWILWGPIDFAVYATCGVIGAMIAGRRIRRLSDSVDTFL